MRKECENAINSKANRELSKSELESIEEQIRGSIKTLRSKDRQAFDAMSPRDRYLKATEIAKERMIEGRVAAHMRSLENATKVKNFIDNVTALPNGKGIGWFNTFLSRVETNRDAVHQDILRKQYKDNPELFELMQDPEQANKIVDAAVFGTDLPEYRKHADGLRSIFNDVHAQLNAAGIQVNYHDRYFPQLLDSGNVGSKDRAEFIADMKERLHRDTFLNVDGTSKTDEEITRIISDNYDNIKSNKDTKNTEELITVRKRSAFDTSRNSTREFQYKDAESLRFIREKYGVHADVHGTVMDYISRAARDIALARELGSNPLGLFKKATELSKAKELSSDKAIAYKQIEKINQQYDRLDKIFQSYTNPDKPGNSAWANFGRNLRTMTALGLTGDVSSAAPDIGVMNVMFAVHNLPFIKGMKDFVKFAVNGKQAKMQSQNLAMVPDEVAGHFARYSGEVIKPGILQKLMPIHQMVSGLRAFDRGISTAIRRAVFNTVGAMTRAHETLDAAVGDHSVIAHLDMKQKHWDVMRAAELDKGEDGEHTLMTPDQIDKVSDDKLRQILADHKEGSDGAYAGIIKEIQQKINDTYDRIETINSNYQAYKDKVNTSLSNYIAHIGNKTEHAQDLKAAHIEHVEALRELADADYYLQQDLLKERHEAGTSMQLQAITEAVKLQSEKAGKAVYTGVGNVLKFAASSTDKGNAKLHRETGKLADKVDGTFDKIDTKVSSVDLKIKDKNNKYTDKQIDKAVRYANRVADLTARVTAAEVRIKELGKVTDQKISTAAKKAEKRVNDSIKELQERINNNTQKINRLSDYLDEYEKQRYRASDKDVRNLRDETNAKLIELGFFFRHRMGRGGSSPDIVERYRFGQTLPAGTLVGELAKYMYQFKQAPIGVAIQQWRQLGEIQGNLNKFKFAAHAALMMTICGAISGQIKAIAKGQDLENMNPSTAEGRAFLLSSFVRGGLLGIYGDLALSTTTDLLANIAGPVAGILKRADAERAAALRDVSDDKASKHSYMQNAWGIGGRLVPFANISYIKGAYNHLVYNRIADLIQPGYSDKKEAKYLRSGKSFYWPPTKTLPQRLPNADNLLKGSRQ